jgi:hypothetical protein
MQQRTVAHSSERAPNDPRPSTPQVAASGPSPPAVARPLSPAHVLCPEPPTAGTVLRVRIHTATVTLMLIFGAAGCGGDTGRSSDPTKEPPAQVASTKQTAPEQGTLLESDFPAGEWPLTVNKGVVHCDGSGGVGAVIFRAPDGTDYAVNGAAKTARPDLPKIEAIWQKDPAVPGTRINIGPVIDKGLELCK